jgi:hypothetical protein
MTKRLTAVLTGLAVGMLGGAVHAEVFVAPKPGQSQEQFKKDQGECHNFAQGQTGVNPAQQAGVAPPPEQRGGAVRGAAAGAAIGAIAGDAGTGAAAGAAAGRIRQNRNNAANAQAAQQAQASQQQQLQRYDNSYAACLAQRGYQTK